MSLVSGPLYHFDPLLWLVFRHDLYLPAVAAVDAANAIVVSIAT